MQLLRARAWIRRIFGLLVFLFGSISAVSILSGSIIIFIGALLHLWASGCLVRNVRLTTWGPYRFIRHPFYLANFLIDLGICTCGANPWIFAVYLAIFYLVYLRRMRKEEKYLANIFGTEYQNYQTKTPFFIPTLFQHYPKTPGMKFSWQRIIQTRNEIPRLLRIFSYPVLFLLQGYAFSLVKSGLFKTPTTLELSALVIFLALQIIALIIRLFTKKSSQT
jgi:protein-S-isoprenylcysteine O-methyltransferase Ste14